MVKGFKVQKLTSGAKESTAPYETREEAQAFLASEVDQYIHCPGMTLTTQTKDELRWTNDQDKEETIAIWIIDIELQAQSVKPEFLDQAEKLEEISKYIESSVDANKIALEYSLDFDDIQEIIDDCCQNIKELVMRVKGEC